MTSMTRLAPLLWGAVALAAEAGAGSGQVATEGTYTKYQRTDDLEGTGNGKPTALGKQSITGEDWGNLEAPGTGTFANKMVGGPDIVRT